MLILLTLLRVIASFKSFCWFVYLHMRLVCTEEATFKVFFHLFINILIIIKSNMWINSYSLIISVPIQTSPFACEDKGYHFQSSPVLCIPFAYINLC